MSWQEYILIHAMTIKFKDPLSPCRIYMQETQKQDQSKSMAIWGGTYLIIKP